MKANVLSSHLTLETEMKNVAHQTYLLELRHELSTSVIKDLYDVITLALA